MSLGALASFADGFAGSFGDRKDREKEKADRERDDKLLELGARQTSGKGGYDPANGTPSDAKPVHPVAYDGKISDRPNYAFNRFVSAGLPEHVAAGLVGNLMQESGTDINPAAVGDSGNAFGSAQWNGPRMRAYNAFASERGASPTDFDTQLDYVLHEGQTSEKGAWGAIMATKTPEEAALVASQKFWRPGAPFNAQRQGYAAAVYRAGRGDSTPAKSATPAAEPPRSKRETMRAQWPGFKEVPDADLDAAIAKFEADGGQLQTRPLGAVRPRSPQ